MTTRILVPLVLLALLLAACGGGSSPHATPTVPATSTSVPVATPPPTTQAVVPFTPVEEVLTPPPDIDTSGWLTYRDDAHGFELKYPPDAQVKQNVRRFGFGPIGVGTEIDLPFPRGTVLDEKVLFIQVAESSSDCKPKATYARYLNNGDALLWLDEEPGGGMSHWLHDWIYMTSIGGSCATLTGHLSGVEAAVVDPTPLPIDAAKESETFAAILSTFRWID